MSSRPPWRDALRRVRDLRVAGTQLAVLVTLSLTTTGLVVVGALADGGGQSSSVLAALAQRGGVLVHQPATTAAASTPAADTTPAAAATPATANTTTSDAAPSSSGSGETATSTDESSSQDTTTSTTPTTTSTTPAATPAQGTKIKHVFVISLTSDGYDATFGTAAAASYLVQQLVPKGVLLTQYRTLDDADLPNGIALLSGQPPNPQTQQNCPTYTEMPSGAKPAADGTIAAAGCVYPVTTLTLADQLGSAGHIWRAYVQSTGKGKTCRRPGPGGADETLTLHPEDPYATRHNPFVYFHSLLDLGDCASNDVDLDDALSTDLATAAKTPSLSLIVPDLCHDGSSDADACGAGQPAGTAAADAFLAKWVPAIQASPAYTQDGLLIVTFGGVHATPVDRHVGTLLLSKWAKPGTTDATAADPYALLRTIEDLFGLKHLGRAGAAGVPSFAPVALGDRP